MAKQIIFQDNFESLTQWSAGSSGPGDIKLAHEVNPEGMSLMRMDIPFSQLEGFVAARKAIAISLPESYRVSVQVRGHFSIKKFEFKLIDPSGGNVWWFQDKDLQISDEWKTLEFTDQQIEFAWGPAGTMSDPLRQISALEFVFCAANGNKGGNAGQIWFKNFQIIDTSAQMPSKVSASSFLLPHEPQSILDPSLTTGWRSLATPEGQSLTIEFDEKREIGGLILHWDPLYPIRGFQIESSLDGNQWQNTYSAERVDHVRSYVYLPHLCPRFLRLQLIAPPNASQVGLLYLEVKGPRFSRTEMMFLKNVAKNEPRGFFPKYLYGEQSYWTVIGTPEENNTQGLINQEGLIEVGKGSFSIEPFLCLNGKFMTWNDAHISQSLEEKLPIPSSLWKLDELTLKITSTMIKDDNDCSLLIRYQLTNTTTQQHDIQFCAALRPFQVTPPWQAHLHFGEISPIQELSYNDHQVLVNQSQSVISLTPVDDFIPVAFDQGPIGPILQKSLCQSQIEKPAQLEESTRWGSGAMVYRVHLAPMATQEIYLCIPSSKTQSTNSLPSLPVTPPPQENTATLGKQWLTSSIKKWRTKLQFPQISLPASEQELVTRMQISAAHVLINRHLEAFQPGPRRYARSWIRDGAVMAAVALRMGWQKEAQDFIRWYSLHQNKQGEFPFGVDRIDLRGEPAETEYYDPREHDSSGEFIFTVAECYRFTRDHSFLEDLWPAVENTLQHIERLRSERLSAVYQSSDQAAFYGLIPESVSHEGYLFQPVHAYWDDYWTLRGLTDAHFLAQSLGKNERAAELLKLSTDFKKNVLSSLQLVIEKNQLDYLPGSVELADFDPTATAVIAQILIDSDFLDQPSFSSTFKKYLQGFQSRHGRSASDSWINYTPYEIRIMGALAKMGDRSSVNDLAHLFLSHGTPVDWHQWPEIIWKDLDAPAHLGDLPHSWVGAEYVFAFLGLFAFERLNSNELVLAAGIPLSWLRDEGVKVENLPTYFGQLSYSLARENENTLKFTITSSLERPPRSIILSPPPLGKISEVQVNGEKLRSWDQKELRLDHLPSEVLIRYSIS